MKSNWFILVNLGLNIINRGYGMKSVLTKRGNRILVWLIFLVWVSVMAYGLYYEIDFNPVTGFFSVFAAPFMAYFWAQGKKTDL